LNLQTCLRITLTAILSAVAIPNSARGQGDWTWKDRDGKAKTKAELETILGKHLLWVTSRGEQGMRADLSGSILDNAILVEGNLRGAKLMRTHLKGANLNGALFGGADLSGAQLNDSYLISAELTETDLDGAELSGANLYMANLKDADLRDAQLKGSHFSSANLENVNFEPLSLPEVTGISGAGHLELLTYRRNPDGLARLRKQFQENGFRNQEREITHALNRRAAELAGPIERWFKRIAFEWTCQYGMNPGRALSIWSVLLLICWAIYAFFIHLNGESGIYRIQKRGARIDGEQTEEQIRPHQIFVTSLWPYLLRLLHRELSVAYWAGFFSLMSAFNIGFREIDFGRWLRMLPRTEYDLKARGWARTVAGLQSLISVYLIALWVLTYFGRPFDQ